MAVHVLRRTTIRTFSLIAIVRRGRRLSTRKCGFQDGTVACTEAYMLLRNLPQWTLRIPDLLHHCGRRGKRPRLSRLTYVSQADAEILAKWHGQLEERRELGQLRWALHGDTVNFVGLCTAIRPRLNNAASHFSLLYHQAIHGRDE